MRDSAVDWVVELPERSFSDWQSALSERGVTLQMTGAHYIGPCILCEGQDCFYIKENHGRVKVGCYGCIDSSVNLPHRIRRLHQLVFGDSRLDPPGRTKSSNTPNLAALLKACLPPERTPAAAYLAAQCVWPPVQIGPRIPRAVRWVNSSDMYSEVQNVTGHPPGGAAGCAVYIYTDREGRPKACELEALRCDGERFRDIDNKAHRWQRTFGDKGGSLFRLSRPRAVELVVVKDPLAALAAWWLFPYSSVAAVGGRSELASIDPAELPPDSLMRIFSDEVHIAGSAAGMAERRLEHAGFEVQLGSIEWEFGTDLQGVLSQQIAESSAPCIHRMPGTSLESNSIFQRNWGTDLEKEEAEAWRPLLDPEEEPYGGTRRIMEADQREGSEVGA